MLMAILFGSEGGRYIQWMRYLSIVKEMVWSMPCCTGSGVIEKGQSGCIKMEIPCDPCCGDGLGP